MADRTTRLVDEAVGVNYQDYRLERTYHLGLASGTLTVAVRVHRDNYREQSWARVEVLSTERTWTIIASSRDWWDDTPSRQALSKDKAVATQQVTEALDEAADDLLHRAWAILGAS